MSVSTTINSKLEAAFEPTWLQVVNESHMHAVPANSETHFKVVIASSRFESKRPVQRHQMVYGVLADELAGGVHALALHTYTPDEWQGQAPDSPACMGGSG